MSRKSRYSAISERSHLWRAGAYIRLSHEDEQSNGKNSQSVITQKILITRFFSEHSEIELIDFYIDDGFTGTDMDRPRFQALREAIGNGTVNCVIVKDLSRLARNYEEASNYVKVIFPFYKIRFISIHENVDSYADPESVYRLDISFQNMMNDEYSHDLSVKVRTAAEIKRLKGEFLGSFAPYGYQKDPSDHHRLLIDEEAARVVRRIFSDYSAIRNLSRIAQTLTDEGIPSPIEYKQNQGCKLKCTGRSERHVWDASTIKRILTSDVYIGNLTQQRVGVISYKDHNVVARNKDEWITVNGTHEPIVSQKQFDAAQIALAEHHKGKKRAGHPSIFGGIAKCGNCGRPLSVTRYLGKDKYRAYYCNSKYKRAADCASFRIKESLLEEAVRTVLNAYLKLFTDMQKSLQDSKRKLQKDRVNRQRDLSSAIATVEEEKRNLYYRLKEGVISEDLYIVRRKKMDDRLAVLKSNEKNPGSSDGQEIIESIEQSSFFKLFAGRRVFRKITVEIAREFIREIRVYSLTEIKVCFAFEDEFRAYLKESFCIEPPKIESET